MSRFNVTPEGATAAAFTTQYLARLTELFDRVDTAAVAAFVDVLMQARSRGSQVFFIGNGGSAATAGHFVNDLTIGTRSWSRPFRAVSLADNVATLTAIANDYGYGEVFVSQLKVLMVPDDVVVAISASGNSPNVVSAVRWANERGGITVGLTGFDGGELKALARVAVHVPTRPGEYGPIEDLHLIFNHLVTAYLRAVCGETGAAER